MQYEICFLDQRGQLSCLMTGQFSDHQHASRFARHAMETATCRHTFYSAEIHREGERLAVTINPRAELRWPLPRKPVAA
jgi:hypothetical protein